MLTLHKTLQYALLLSVSAHADLHSKTESHYEGIATFCAVDMTSKQANADAHEFTAPISTMATILLLVRSSNLQKRDKVAGREALDANSDMGCEALKCFKDNYACTSRCMTRPKESQNQQTSSSAGEAVGRSSLSLALSSDSSTCNARAVRMETEMDLEA